MKAPVYIVDIFDQVLAKVRVDTGFNINYVYGQTIDIVGNLKTKDENSSQKDTKYPLFALYMPFLEKKGKDAGYYCDLFIRKIVIANLTKQDDLNADRYTNVFKPILYPVYISFLKRLVQHPNVIPRQADDVSHTKVDYPGKQPIQGVNDFVDSIQLENLTIKIVQTKTC